MSVFEETLQNPNKKNVHHSGTHQKVKFVSVIRSTDFSVLELIMALSRCSLALYTNTHMNMYTVLVCYPYDAIQSSGSCNCRPIFFEHDKKHLFLHSLVKFAVQKNTLDLSFGEDLPVKLWVLALLRALFCIERLYFRFMLVTYRKDSSITLRYIFVET